jgi:glutathione synthase/RimK-type ligase-like ATP-grasp enzyme
VILLWGLTTDGPLSAVRNGLDRLGAEYVFLNQCRQSAVVLELRFGARVEGCLSLRMGEPAIDLSRIRSAYLRPYDGRGLSGAGDESARLRAAAIDTALMAWAEVTSTLVVNRPSAMWSNNSKPYQAQLIRQCGFQAPDTLVTTTPRTAYAFCRMHRRVVYKSVSGIRSIVTQLGAEDFDRLTEVDVCPTQFQAYVPGDDYRIHVVGRSVFATRVRSTAIDYRYPGASGSPADTVLDVGEIPSSLGKACRKLSARLGLVVSGIDLRRTPEGEWYCFEVNPSPGFSYYEEVTGQPIAAAIARLLTGGHPVRGSGVLQGTRLANGLAQRRSA